MMSADLEMDPHEQAKLHPDHIITASRWKSGGGFQGYNPVKLVCNYVFERLIALFYLTRLRDLTFGYRLFPADLMKRILWSELMHPFFLETALKPLRLGVSFIEVPCQWHARPEGQSVNPFFANFQYFRTAWHDRFLKTEGLLR